MIQLSDGNSVGGNFNYDRVTKVDVSNGCLSQILVANNQAAYDYANNAGFTVMLASTTINRSDNTVSLTTFLPMATALPSFNRRWVRCGANREVTGYAFSSESDGTGHVGESSIVLSDESVSSNGNDDLFLEFGAAIGKQ